MRGTFIKPFHLFQHNDGWYLIDIESMSASSIDPAAARALAGVGTTRDGMPAPCIKGRPGKPDLLSVPGHQTRICPNPAKSAAIPIVNMSLFLTNACNLRCVYCYEDELRDGTGGDMEEKTAFRAVDWLIEQSGEMKKIHISFFGGEPFLKFALMKSVVDYAEKRVSDLGKAVAFHASSNGTILDHEKISYIKNHRINVMISFDGPKEIQDIQRPYASGQGSYDYILPGIKSLLASVPETPGHAVILGNSDRQMVKRALQKIGFKRISIMPASPPINSGESSSKPANDIEHILNQLDDEMLEWVELCRKRDYAALHDLKAGSSIYPALTALLHNRKKRFACGAGRGLVAVDCSGDVYLCHRFVGQKHYRLGSIHSNDLQREEYLESPTTANDICTNCFARYYCAGGCKHENAASSGSIYIPPSLTCRRKRRELELAASFVGGLNENDRAFLIEQKIFPPKPCPLDF